MSFLNKTKEEFMNTSQVIVNKFSKINFLSRVMYILKDVMFIYTFFALCIKNLLFLSVLKSSGASKLPATFNILNIFNVHIFVWFIIIFISFAFLAHNKLHLWILVAINSLYSIILVGDLWHYRGFDSFLSLHLLKETGNLNNL